jgi:putative membrane protein
MGLANLVPGVSGGTMILALGFYERFIESFSNVSKLKFYKKDIIFLGAIVIMAFATILGLSTVIQFLMEFYRPYMLALFIGLTLGGAPTILTEIKNKGKGIGFWLAFLGAIVLMALIAFVFEPSSLPTNFVVFFFAGIVGSTAMILPGISGSYLLLILGLYLPIIASISDFKLALIARDFTQLFSIGTEVILPFSLGMLVGILVLSNFLSYLLSKHQRLTQTFLLGLLLGSVLGLYPFNSRPLEKLVKHQKEGVLKVHLYGELNSENKLYKQIERLEDFGPKVVISKKVGLSESSVAEARQSGAVILIFKEKIDQKVRDLSKNKELGKVALVILSDTSYSHIRLMITLLLILVGVVITYIIGKLKREKE